MADLNKAKGLKKEFLDFALRGNLIDMSVGVIVGGAFSKIVTSIVNDLLMPLLSPITGSLNFSELFIPLDGNAYATLAEAKEAGAAVFAYGNFLTTLVDFLIIAICVFFMVRMILKLRRAKKEEPAAPAEPTTKQCPYCLSEIAIGATRCPHCTSELSE